MSFIEAMKSNKKQLYVLNVRHTTFEEPNEEKSFIRLLEDINKTGKMVYPISP
jgi:hypothetical protein